MVVLELHLPYLAHQPTMLVAEEEAEITVQSIQQVVLAVMAVAGQVEILQLLAQQTLVAGAVLVLITAVTIMAQAVVLA
jgi:hypothetical protein